MHEHGISIDLNPDMADNNVVLSGSTTDGSMSGMWYHATCAGGTGAAAARSESPHPPRRFMSDDGGAVLAGRIAVPLQKLSGGHDFNTRKALAKPLASFGRACGK